ncbi:hypothetical protein FHU38_002756 [Saccharomonospora amisosensis]|uniref:Uncharacterized protein n=1 Tax=Saccharomonospora amisosensis TaxID=1128677 RepID=A0A7X5UR83_9PSEU|nr:hypothetical protein [Saccharomonospora amisosensis]NIJ12412.1 hypothetical protein [Saccharomonospora amisosensis]
MTKGRRGLAATLGALVGLAGHGLATGLFTQTTTLLPWWAYVTWLAAGVLSGWLAATYVNPAGGIATGCTSCGRVAILTIPMSILLASQASLPTSVLAVLLLAFGLAQRLRTGDACAVPVAEPAAATAEQHESESGRP